MLQFFLLLGQLLLPMLWPKPRSSCQRRCFANSAVLLPFGQETPRRKRDAAFSKEVEFLTSSLRTNTRNGVDRVLLSNANICQSQVELYSRRIFDQLHANCCKCNTLRVGGILGLPSKAAADRDLAS